VDEKTQINLRLIYLNMSSFLSKNLKNLVKDYQKIMSTTSPKQRTLLFYYGKMHSFTFVTNWYFKFFK
jgi:hypothetical protein